MNREIKNAWDLKVNEAALEKWIKEGIDPDKKIKITISNRNFRTYEQSDKPRGQKRQRGNRDRGDRGDRGDRRGRGGRRDREGGDRDRRKNRTDNNQPEKKKVYVDKNTGKAPTNKLECEQQLIQEKESSQFLIQDIILKVRQNELECSLEILEIR